jgi:hypothetical protein
MANEPVKYIQYFYDSRPSAPAAFAHQENMNNDGGLHFYTSTAMEESGVYIKHFTSFVGRFAFKYFGSFMCETDF